MAEAPFTAACEQGAGWCHRPCSSVGAWQSCTCAMRCTPGCALSRGRVGWAVPTTRLLAHARAQCGVVLRTERLQHNTSHHTPGPEPLNSSHCGPAAPVVNGGEARHATNTHPVLCCVWCCRYRKDCEKLARFVHRIEAFITETEDDADMTAPAWQAAFEVGSQAALQKRCGEEWAAATHPLVLSLPPHDTSTCCAACAGLE